MPAEQDAAHPRADREQDGRCRDDGRSGEPLACQQVRPRDQHGGRVRGVAAGKGGLGLSLREGAGGARAAIDELHGVMGEDRADRCERERREHGQEGAASRGDHDRGARRADGRMHVRLARQRAEARRAQHPGALPRTPRAQLDRIVERLQAPRTRREREGDDAQRGEEGDDGEARHEMRCALWKRNGGREYLKWRPSRVRR
jgi:hypothetical protein